MSFDKYLDRVYDAKNYNCAHFVSEVWGDIYGTDISNIIVTQTEGWDIRQLGNNIRDNFVRLQKPENFCLVSMRMRINNDYNHIGVYKNGRVLHLYEFGVRFELLETCYAIFNKVSFYAAK